MAFAFDGDAKTITLSTGTTSMTAKDCYSRAKDWLITHAWSSFPLVAVGGDALGGSVYAGDYYFLQDGWTIVPQDANHTLLVTGNLYPQTPGTQMFGSRVGRTIQVQLSRSSLTQTIAVGSGVLPADITAIATASRNAILSDSTPFAGARIDAAITSRSVAGEGLTVGQAATLTQLGTRVDAAISTRATAGQGLTVEQAAAIVELQVKVGELSQLMGLDLLAPLVVDATSRTAGTIEQTITDVGGVVTVTRTA